MPAGYGDTANFLKELGANVTGADLYPEIFRYHAIKCIKGNLNERLPFEDESFDWVICQEGIEHMPNQLHLFQELNRILRKGGRAIITTPNYSNLRARFSYALLESETYRIMPPNEIDSVWAAENAKSINDVYLGHIFFANITRQRVLAELSGMKLLEAHPSSINITSLVLLLFYYPWMKLVGWIARRRSTKNEIYSSKREAVYDELAQINSNLNILTGGHLILEFEKQQEAATVIATLSGKLDKDVTSPPTKII